MSHVAERYESLTAEFDAFRRHPAFGTGASARARDEAFQRFVERGFPTTRDEDWRFTNVAPIANTTFVRGPEAPLSHAVIAPYLFAGLPAIVVVNGRVSKSLSNLDALPAGLSFATTSEVVFPNSDQKRPPRSFHPFADLNTAFVEDVVVLDVAPKTVVAEPIQVLFVTVAESHAAMAAPRLVVRLGEASECSIIESYASVGQHTTWTNASTEIDLAPGAVLDHVKVQRESDSAFHIAGTHIRLDRASTFASRSLTFGGRITRNDISAVLDGDGAECTLNGLYVAGGDSLVDNHTSIDHAKPNCPSHEVYKGILSGRAKAVFNGKIVVELDAQKTNAKQTNKALLLSDDAQINTKPQLEIFADDVKCTHGAAIGQLDEDAMFYLRARGIAETDARALLIHAFASQVLDEIKNSVVRERVQQVLDAKLAIG